MMEVFERGSILMRDHRALLRDPFARSVRVRFALPDGHTLLERFEHITRRRVRLRAARMRHRDRHARVAQLEMSYAVLDDGGVRVEALRRFAQDSLHL